MTKHFFYNKTGQVIGAIVKTEREFNLFDNERNFNQQEYNKLLLEFDKIDDIKNYNTFSFLDDEKDNLKFNKFILYSGNINDL